jgi:hypothetical protein
MKTQRTCKELLITLVVIAIFPLVALLYALLLTL